MKPGTILKSKDMIVCESKLEECQRQNRESLARMRKLENIAYLAKNMVIALVAVGDNESVNYHINKLRDAINDLEGVKP